MKALSCRLDLDYQQLFRQKIRWVSFELARCQVSKRAMESNAVEPVDEVGQFQLLNRRKDTSAD